MVIKKKNRVGLSADVQEWKPLQLNQAILSSGIEGLIGIEELVDYKPALLQTKSKKDVSEDSRSIQKAKKSERKGSVRVNKKSFATNSLKSEKGCSSGEHVSKMVAKTYQVKQHDLTETKTNKYTNSKPNKSAKKSSKPTTLNKFLESEKLEIPIASALNLISQRKKGRNNKQPKKIATCLNKQTDFTEISMPTDELLVQRSLKSRKRSMSPGTSTTGVPTKKKKQQSKQTKIKKDKKSDIPEDISGCKIINNKKQTVSPSVNAKRKKKTNKIKPNTAVVKEIDAKVLSPVTGMEAWLGLNLPDSILRALAEKGFKAPTGIQALSLPSAILGRRDIMGAAETGSGKTLAFGIPIIYGILQQKKKEASLKCLDEDVEIECDEITTQLEDETNIGLKNDLSGLSADEDAIEKSDDDDENRDNASGYDSEGIGTNAEGIGCVKVIDDCDMSQVMANPSKTPLNPLHNRRLYALVLTPTRELAVQVRDHLKAAAKYTGIRVAVVIGGLAAQKQERLLRTAPEIVVATPGRLWELIQEGNEHLQQVDDISFLAIDETDRMMEKGHFQELQELLERINLNEEKKKNRQNFVFSATLTMVHEPPYRKKNKNKKKSRLKVTPGQKLQDVVRLLGITNPKLVDVTQESGTSGTLEEAQISCTFEEKDFYLYYFLIKHPGRTLIFCNSISCVRRLAQLLTILKCKPLPIHANMVQRQRLRNLDKFRDNPTGLLLATDVAARGLDVPNVEHVIHYQVPRTSEGYIHRSGRTARASKEGLTLLLIEPEEQRSYLRLCRTLGRQQQLPVFPISHDLLKAAKQRVMLARDIDQLELTSRRADSEMGWFQKAMSDMDIMLDDDEIPTRISKKDSAGNRKVANSKRKQLDSLLSRPLFSTRT